MRVVVSCKREAALVSSSEHDAEKDDERTEAKVAAAAADARQATGAKGGIKRRKVGNGEM